jgi:plastocyanin
MAPVNISQTEALKFVPDTVQAAPGQQVIYSNASTMMTHSATGDTGGGPNSDSQFPSGMRPGTSYTFTVPANAPSGSKIFYHCRFHGAPGNGTTKGLGMVGEIDIQ